MKISGKRILRRSNLLRKFTFSLVTVAITLILVEIGLHLVTIAGWGRESLKIGDDRLQYRPNPRFPDHDQHGFRNQCVPAMADIVALGDSQTYGTGVAAQEAWPKQLEAATKKSVYSMAFGGYCPVHSLILWDEAIRLKPRIIIEGFYAGNDLFDAFNLVYNYHQHPELKTSDEQLAANIQKAEESEPIIERISNHASEIFTMKSEQHGFLRRYSKLYDLCWAIRFLYAQKSGTPQQQWIYAQTFATARPERCEAFDCPPFRTVFTPGYRLCGLDLTDPRILEGHRICLKAISRINQLARQQQIKFLVINIPTKELVFREICQDALPKYRTLVRNESRMWEISRCFFEENDIAYVDVLSALRAQLADGLQPYPVSHDSHPNKYGHAAIVNSLESLLFDSGTD